MNEAEQRVAGVPPLSRREGTGCTRTQVSGLAVEGAGDHPGPRRVLQASKRRLVRQKFTAGGFHLPGEGQRSSLLSALPGFHQAFWLTGGLQPCGGREGLQSHLIKSGMRLRGLGSCPGSQKLRLSPAPALGSTPVFPPPPGLTGSLDPRPVVEPLGLHLESHCPKPGALPLF